MPPEVLILTSFRQQVIVVLQQVVAVVLQQVVAVVLQQVVAVVLQQVVPAPQAFAGKIQQTELCLPLQLAIASSFYLPPKKFCS